MITEKTDQIEAAKPKNSGKIFNAILVGFKVVMKGISVATKFTKIALAGISLAAYSYMYSWQFALILMFQLLIHEYGHIWAMKRCGMKTKGIYFIPFVGGAAVASEDFKTRNDEVFVALMGPVFGFGCAGFMMILYYATGEAMYAAGASWMAMINLFNLLPINPLDGGRVMKSIAFSLHSWVGIIFMVLGIIASIFLAFVAGIWIFILLVLLSSLELMVDLWLIKRYNKRADASNAPKIVINDEIDRLIEKCKNNEDLLKHIPDKLELDEKVHVKDRMTKKQIFFAVFQYFALAILLYMFMQNTAHIPGAAMAMEFLRD